MLPLLLLFIQQGVSAQPVATYTDGACVDYSGMCSPFVGSKVFIGSNDTLSDREELIYTALTTVRANEAVLAASCILAQDRYWCAQTFQQCKGPGELPNITYSTPVLACKVPACKDLWEKCSDSFSFYLSTISNDASKSAFVSCGGTYTFTGANAQPADRYYPSSTRNIPNYPLRTPKGYADQPIFPDTAATYTYPNGTTASIPCYTITNADRTTKITLVTNKTSAPTPAVAPKSSTQQVLPALLVTVSAVIVAAMAA